MNNKKVIFASMIGNALEFYDFTLYGFLAPIFAPLFFPSGDPYVSLIASLGVFAAGFLMRPIGAILFGHIGDRYGRKTALTIAILMMAVPTTLIGLLPTYEQIGIWAPILMILCRMSQGLSTGGEYNGAAIFVLEHQKGNNGAFYGALITASCPIGSLLGTLMGAIFSLPMMPDWGWRLPFIAGIVIGFVGVYIRRTLHESPEFEKLKEKNEIAKSPLKNALLDNPKSCLTILGIAWLSGVVYYTCFVYVGTSLTTFLNWPLSKALTVTSLGMVTYAIFAPVAGRIADRYSELQIMIPASLGIILFAYPFFWLVNSGLVANILIAVFVLAMLNSFFSGPVNALMLKLFDARERYSGIAFSYGVGMALFGGTAPMILTWLAKSRQDINSPAFWLLISALAGFIAVSMARSIVTKIGAAKSA